MSTVPAATKKKGKGIHVTREQKSILKDAFKFIPYPDQYPDSLEKLSADTGLDQEAIKKWFRNRRKKMATNENEQEDVGNDDDKSVDESLNVSSVEKSGPVDDNNLVVNEVIANESIPAKGNSSAVNINTTSENENSASVENEAPNKAGVLSDLSVNNDKSVVSLESASVVDEAATKAEIMTEPVKFSNGTDDSVDKTVVHKSDLRDIECQNIENSMKVMESSIPADSDSNIPVDESARTCVQEKDNGDEDSVDLKPSENNDVGSIMSTEDKAAHYDVLKQEFSNLQSRFESLAKVLGSHGIDVGENHVPTLPSPTEQPNSELPSSEVSSYFSHPTQQSNSHHGVDMTPKQEPHSYGWDYNPQPYNQQWHQYPPYSYHNNFSYPYAPQTYSLPYPPPDHQICPIPPVTHAVYHTTPQYQDTPNSLSPTKTTSEETPATKGHIDLHANPVNPSFKGDIAAPKKSFQGPSKKLKRKSVPPAVSTSVYQNNPLQPSSKSLIRSDPPNLKQPRMQSVNSKPMDLALRSSSIGQKSRRKSFPMKTKLGAHPKPSPKKVPLLEQSLQANNPFRRNKNSGQPAKRLSVSSSPKIQTLFPPIQNFQGLKRKSTSPDIEYLSTERSKPIQISRLPNLGTGISIQKVHNPLTDPNKPKELQKVMAMSHLSISMARK